jgi:DNA-binding NtrC family response regulator
LRRSSPAVPAYLIESNRIVTGTEARLPRDEQAHALAVLVVDDEDSLRESCATVLREAGHQVQVSGRGGEALEIVRRRRFDLVLLDLQMTRVSGLELMAECLAAYPGTLVIITTGNPSIRSSIEALRAGAWEYLPKPFSATHLQILLGRAVHACAAGQRLSAPGPAEARTAGPAGVALLGESPGLRTAVALATRVAQTDASVFISGESGTGKEQIAQFIHASSRRSSRELVAVNCAALPEGLLESEMFGHAAGAFTGAFRDKPGLLETANGGTLFMDEVTEMPPVIQAKLLRVIQDGQVRRLGSNSTDAVVSVRFISATNRSMRNGLADDVFRSDLFYRLCVVPIHIPPLRERTGDIRVLAEHFLARYWHQHRGALEDRPVLGPDALAELERRTWPGNVRELQNVMEHAVVLVDPGRVIQPEDLPDLSGQSGTSASDRGLVAVQQPVDESYHGARERVLSRFESRYLRWLVGKANGNMSMAARVAGVDRTTLYRLMEKHKLQRDAVITPRRLAVSDPA